jgi:hypothetical protein
LGQGQLILETLVRDQTLLVQISNTFALSGKNVSEYRVMQADGRPLPDWLERVGAGLLAGKRPANSETLNLRVIAVLSDGTSETREVTIRTNSGEIQPLSPGKHTEVPTRFSHHLRSTAMLTGGEVNTLGRHMAALLATGRR